MAGDRLERILAELSAGAGARSSVRLCEVSTYITSATGAGVMLMSGDVPQGSVCSSNDVSALIEDLQYTLGEGPCVDAYHQDRVVAEPDLADPGTPRWLAFTPRAVEAGARAVFGFPLRVGSARLGALNLYLERAARDRDVARRSGGRLAMSREESVVRSLVEMADILVDDYDVIDVLTGLTDRCVNLLGASAAGVMLVSPEGDLRLVASSSEA